VKDGYVAPPEGPGIGVGLNEEEARKHPHGQDNFPRLFEDGWQQRK
jgi:galactonate dehydratase